VQINSARGALPSLLRVGFIGVGIRGIELLQATRNISRIDVVAACDLYKGHLERVREICGDGIETTRFYEDILSRDDIDAVVVAVPDHWHKKLYLDCLAAGKHLYAEKPLTYKLEDGKALIEAVDQSKKVVQVGSQTLSAKCAGRAREMVRSGRLGNVTMVEARIYRQNSQAACYYPIPPDATPETVDWERFLGDAAWHEFDPVRFFQWRLFWDYTGGLTTDLFVHLVSATHYILDVTAPEMVAGFSGIYNWKDYREVPDQVAAIVTYPEGFMLKLTTSANFEHREPTYTFYGTEGILEYDGASMKYFHRPARENFRYSTNCYPEEMKERIRQTMNLDENMSPIVAVPAAATEAVEYAAPGGEDSTTAHLRNFFEAIRSDSEPLEDIRFGVNAVNVGHLVNMSCRSGKVVRWNAKMGEVEV
jgi:predicted dehydrogenase